MDFIVDGLATVRMVHILSVVEPTRGSALCLEADTSLGTKRVTRSGAVTTAIFSPLSVWSASSKGVLIDHRQHADPAAVWQPLCHDVHRTPLVGTRR